MQTTERARTKRFARGEESLNSGGQHSRGETLRRKRVTRPVRAFPKEKAWSSCWTREKNRSCPARKSGLGFCGKGDEGGAGQGGRTFRMLPDPGQEYGRLVVCAQNGARLCPPLSRRGVVQLSPSLPGGNPGRRIMADGAGGTDSPETSPVSDRLIPEKSSLSMP